MLTASRLPELAGFHLLNANHGAEGLLLQAEFGKRICRDAQIGALTIMTSISTDPIEIST